MLLSGYKETLWTTPHYYYLDTGWVNYEIQKQPCGLQKDIVMFSGYKDKSDYCCLWIQLCNTKDRCIEGKCKSHEGYTPDNCVVYGYNFTKC